MLRSMSQFNFSLNDNSSTNAAWNDEENDLYINDTAIRSTSRYDLFGLLRNSVGIAENICDDAKPALRTVTPPLEMLDLIREQDQDEEVLVSQRNFLNWTFSEGNIIGAYYDEGDFDIDEYASTDQNDGLTEQSQGDSGESQTGKEILKTFGPYQKGNKNPETALEEPAAFMAPMQSMSYMSDPLVRYFSSLLKRGLTESFRQIFQMVSVNQRQYLALHTKNLVTDKDFYIKKEPGLLVQLGDAFGQIEFLSQNGLHDSAFSTCYSLIQEYHQHPHNVEIVLETLKYYLHKLSKKCREDGGKCQAVASCILADHLKLKEKDVEFFKLYIDVYFLSKTKSWTLDNEILLADHAARNLFDLYIRWGQAQHFPVIAEEYYIKAQKMADHTRNNRMRLTAACCLVESSFLLNRLDVEGSRMILADLRNSLDKQNNAYFAMENLMDWAEALLLLRENRYEKSTARMKRYIHSQEAEDNPHQLHKAYREIALLYEQQGHTHVAFHLFQSAWQSKRRAPVLPDVGGMEDTIKQGSPEAVKPDNKHLDFISYIKSIYHDISDPARRKHAVEICQLYLELMRPTRKEIDSEGYGHVNIDAKLTCLDHEIRLPLPCEHKA